MSGTFSVPVAPAAGRVALLARRHRVPLVLLALSLSTWFALGAAESSSRVAIAWPAAGFTAGLLLIAPERRRLAVLGAGFLLVATALVLRGYPVVVALGLSGTTVLCALTVRWRLHRRLGKSRV